MTKKKSKEPLAQHNFISQKPTYYLQICEAYTLTFYNDKFPNAWYRFWQFIFFGFKYIKGE